MKAPPTSPWLLSGAYPAKDPAMTQHDPLQPAKPERTTAVAGTTAGIAFTENINHPLPEAAWDMETKHRERANVVLRMF